jgi:hypothetical protein
MCCFNAPYCIILPWFLYYSSNEDEELTICRRVLYGTLFYTLLPICFILDIISIPFHLLNVLLRSYLHIPYNDDYIYDAIFRFTPVSDDFTHIEGGTAVEYEHDINRHRRASIESLV